jgi:hypothetical protein
MMNSFVVIQSKHHHHHHHHHHRKKNVDHRSRGLQEQKKSVRGAKLSTKSSSNNETFTENDDDETMMKDVQVTFVDCVASDGAKMTKETRRNAEGSIEEMDNCRFVRRHRQSRRFKRLKDVGFVFFSPPPFFVKLLLAIRCNNKKHSFS